MKEKDEISETKDTIEEGAGSPDTGEESKTDPGAGAEQDGRRKISAGEEEKEETEHTERTERKEQCSAGESRPSSAGENEEESEKENGSAPSGRKAQILKMDFAGDDERIPDDIGATGGGRLLRAFGGIDGKYVAEAAAGEDESEEDRAGRADFTRRFNRWGSLVAALAVTLAAVVIYQGISRGVRTESDGEQPALGTAAENTAAAGKTAVGESTDEEASGAQSDGVWLSAAESGISASEDGDEAAVQDSPESIGQEGTGSKESLWTEFTSLEDAEKYAGVTIAIPDEFAGFRQSGYSAMENEVLEVRYLDGEDGFTVRKSDITGTNQEMTDLSGDYTEYPDVRTISDITSDYASKETKISAEIRGSGSRYSVAVWTISKGNGVISSYAVTVSGSGFTEDEMRELIAEIY